MEKSDKTARQRFAELRADLARANGPHFANLHDMHKKYAYVLPVSEVLDYYRRCSRADA